MSTRFKNRFVALAAVTAVLLAACGGASESASPTLPSLTETPVAGVQTTTTLAVDPEEAMLEFAACMREQGIDMPDPSSGQSGTISFSANDIDFEAFDEADKECSPILEAAFGDFEMNPEQEAEMRDRELAFAQCMRDEGLDWPDPGALGGAVIDLGTDVDPDIVNAALEACSDESFGDTGLIGVVGSGGPGSDSDTP